MLDFKFFPKINEEQVKKALDLHTKRKQEINNKVMDKIRIDFNTWEDFLIRHKPSTYYKGFMVLSGGLISEEDGVSIFSTDVF